jgi:hypothetical protein
MWNSRSAYHAIGQELGLHLLPVGDAFWKMSNNPRWGYQRDTLFDFQKPVTPALPDQTNSLHVRYFCSKDWGKIAFDANHVNEAGCYLGSSIWYGSLFGDSLEKLETLTFAPPRVPQDFAAFLRRVATQALKVHQANPA